MVDYIDLWIFNHGIGYVRWKLTFFNDVDRRPQCDWIIDCSGTSDILTKLMFQSDG